MPPSASSTSIPQRTAPPALTSGRPVTRPLEKLRQHTPVTPRDHISSPRPGRRLTHRPGSQLPRHLLNPSDPTDRPTDPFRYRQSPLCTRRLPGARRPKHHPGNRTAQPRPPRTERRYFDTIDFSGPPHLVRQDRIIAFSWDHVAPAPGMNPHRYAVRWTGELLPPAPAPTPSPCMSRAASAATAATRYACTSTIAKSSPTTPQRPKRPRPPADK